MPQTFPPAATSKRLVLGFVDDSGDVRSVSIRARAAAADADLLALATAIGAASNANLYKASIELVREAAPSASGANSGEQNSVYENIVFLYKDVTTGATQNVFIPAPLETTMVGDSDTPDITEPLIVAVINAANAVLDGEVVSARYTERREINEKVRI